MLDPHPWQPFLCALVAAQGAERTPALHDLRHSFISNQLAAGTPIHVVRDMAAHRNLVITARYAHGTDEARRAAFDRVQIEVGAGPDRRTDPDAVAPTVAPSVVEVLRRKASKSRKTRDEGEVPRDGIEPPTRGFSTRYLGPHIGLDFGHILISGHRVATWNDTDRRPASSFDAP